MTGLGVADGVERVVGVDAEPHPAMTTIELATARTPPSSNPIRPRAPTRAGSVRTLVRRCGCFMVSVLDVASWMDHEPGWNKTSIQ
jgi:hypothetical protein